MRQRSIFAIGLFSALAASTLLACEDGPSQTFTSAPANAANLWNNGNPDASVSNAKASFDASFGSVSALQNCTADQKRLVWANMLQQPIALPLQFAGINLAGKTVDEQHRFVGITLQEAESINCVGNPLGPGGITWGDNGEVEFDYNTSNYVVSDIGINLGYTGKMTMSQRPHSRFGSHEYVFQLGQPILRDNATYEINWSDITHHDLNEIFNAIMATFGAGLVGTTTNDPDENDCYQDGSCIIVGPAQAPGNGGACAMIFLPIEGFIFETDCTTNVQPTISIPIAYDQQYYLSEPYSYMANIQNISAQGPLSVPRFNTPGDPPDCFLQIGMDWATYVKNCIDFPPPGLKLSDVLSDGGLTIQQTNEAKMYAAHTHDYETIDFNIVGENLDWADETVIESPTAIVEDPTLPNKSDPIQARTIQWGTDIYDNGLPMNDTDVTGANFTGQGTGYIYREWSRLMQDDVNKQLAAAHPCPAGQTTGCGTAKYNHLIGDTACFTDPVSANALGCTGLEGLVLTGPSDLADSCGSTSPAPICANYAAGAYFGYRGAGELGAGGYGASALHSGSLYSVFCQDPRLVNGGTVDGGGLDPLNGNCVYNTVWIGALTNVTTVAGLGNVNTLPGELADRRYYFRWYGIAEVKYLKAYGKNTASNAADVAAQKIDMESVFYDVNGPFDFLEYIERSYMTDTTTTYVKNQMGSASAAGAVTIPGNVNSAPMDFSIGVETLAGEYQFTSWYKFMYRPEVAMFRAMLVNKADLPGSENNVNITNLAGSTLLQGDYGSYECATQWPNVTIAALGITDEPWAQVCSDACPNAFQNVYPTCPLPPLAPVTATSVSCAAPGTMCPAGTGCNPYTQFCQSLALDLNGANPSFGLGGTTGRLAGYPAVWGQGAACPDATDICGDDGKCGVSGLVCIQNSDCTPGLNPNVANNNAFSTAPCGNANIPVASGVGSVFAVGHKAYAANRLKFISTDQNQLTAYVSIPAAPNPYNAIQGATATAPTPITTTVSWSPDYDGVGFNIPLDATHDKFVQTQQVDFGGILDTFLLDVVPWTNPLTNKPDGTLTVDAIEGDDYLGEAFLCQDVGSFPVPGSGDLLGAHMYDSAASILDWITQHPASEVNCQIVVRYTVYNNYVDFITSLSAGVQLAFSTGTALGRVQAVVAFDPTLVGAP